MAAVAEPVTLPYGAWPSAIAAADLAGAAVAMADLQVANGQPWWRESRPEERGRQVLVTRDPDGTRRIVTPGDFDVRTRVHEYGGASYLVLPDGSVVFSHYRDQRLYRQRPGRAPEPLTPAGYRYADCTLHPAGDRLVCVREDHTEATRRENGEERNEIVAVPLDAGGPGTVLVTGSDFVAYPRLSPDGRRLAWVQWNHPNMPWDSSTLHVAELGASGIGKPVQVAGGPAESVIEPAWDRDGSLYFISDRSGWWNLYRWRDGEVRAVSPMARESGGPLWTHGASSYALTGDGRAVVRHSQDAVDRLGVLDLGSGTLRDLDLPFTSVTDIRLLDRDTAVLLAGSALRPPVLLAIDLSSGAHRVLHEPAPTDLAAEWISVPEAIEFPTAAGPGGEPRTAHAWFYPPRNPQARGPKGERPPLLVFVHGGPTAVARASFSLQRQYWTSRGFAIVDVNYGGSTTYGRDYRRRLNGQWGVVDVQDCVAAVDYLVGQGRVHADRVAIRGGSAGGFTTLAALAFTDRFKAGANYFGISDIAALAADSHKFERMYDVSLVGPPDPALYRARSPIHHLDRFSEPLVTFQGSEDKVVPPNQSRMIVEALRRKGVPVAYLEFEGEAHGFRRAENIVRAQEAELYFYGAIFGFEPDGDIEPLPIDNWPMSAR
jgi:dipeptidyl aminopeptidase/acylaminoacyl peptidase